MAVTARRVSPTLLVILSIVVTTVVAWPTAAYADPEEGGSAELSAKLEAVAAAFYDTQAKLVASQQRQVEIKKNLALAEASLVQLSAEVSAIAAERYKSGHLGLLHGFLFNQGDTTNALRSAAVGQYLADRDDEALRRHRLAREEAERNRALLEVEIANEKAQLKELDKQKREAEKALAAVGGMVSAGYAGPAPAVAQPAPRNADGSFPRESCSINDPTTGGCLTPRTFHALNEARLAKFNRAVYCWRTQSWGDHPRGRACDFSLKWSGFGGMATPSEKTYGTNLAQYFIRNASTLGVGYVIWYRQIWTPAAGWRSYFGTGTSSREHTNHVHLSMI